MTQRIGLMGGTFDPIHFGHLVAAETAKELAQLDEVWFMPTYRPPHKQQTDGASPERRRDMVQIAIAGIPYFRLEPLELDRGGISYAIDTAELLTNRFPDKSFFWIIGGDMACYLPQWYRILDLVRMVTFVALNRPGYTTDLTTLPASIQERVQLFEMVALDVSSTTIRQRLRHGQTVRFLLPDQVLDYIHQQGIYSEVRQQHEL